MKKHTAIELAIAFGLGITISTASDAYRVRRDCEEKMTKKGTVETCKTVLVKEKEKK
jgi:hypothetical protein